MHTTSNIIFISNFFYLFKNILKFFRLKSTPLEKLESIDMLRVIEYGYDVNLIEVSGKIQSVDTPKDLKRVNKLIR